MHAVAAFRYSATTVRPGIYIEHTLQPPRSHGLVRCDVGGIIGFIPRERWPDDASAGDLVEFVFTSPAQIEDHPQGDLIDVPARRAVRSFFENGGEVVHVFAVCLSSIDDLRRPDPVKGPLAPLLHRLEGNEEIAILACPAAASLRVEVSRGGVVRTDADGLYEILLAHCRAVVNRFLVIDAPRGLHDALLARWFETFRASGDPDVRAFGAVYYPWLKRGDEVFPPSGAVMGMFARVEREHGPYGIAWPPANTNLMGATHTEVELDWGEAGIVGDVGVNPLVVQPGRGVVVWGARTMSADQRWTWINSRRVVSMVSEQLRRDNEWAIFEVNDPSLWKVIERDVRVRLDQFHEAGMLAGARNGDQYSVDCNEATNPPALRQQGVLSVAVRLRPVGTTERILIDLRLGSGGA